MKTAYIVVAHDRDPDMSWLPEEERDDHVALEMVAYDDEGEMVDCLGSIDFYAAYNDWATGEFHRIAHLPEGSYLRDCAREMGLPE